MPIINILWVFFYLYDEFLANFSMAINLSPNYFAPRYIH